MSVNAYDKLSYGEFNLPSLQELMIAPSYQRQQHDLSEQQYLEQQALNTQTKSRLIPGRDDEALNIIGQNDEFIQQSISNLSDKGINPSTKRSLLKAKSDYLNTVAPIEKWAADREAKAAQVADLKLKDPTLFAQNPLDVSISKWMTDPSSRDVGTVSGSQITQRVATAAKQFSDYVAKKAPELMKSGIPYEYFTAVMAGADLNEVAQALSKEGIDPSTASDMTKMLAKISDDVMTSSRAIGYFGNNTETMEKIQQFANEGLYMAIGATKFGNISDSYNKALALERYKASQGNSEVSSARNIRAFDSIKVGDTDEGKRITEMTSTFNKVAIPSGISKEAATRKTKELSSQLSEYTKEHLTDPRKAPVYDPKLNKLRQEHSKYKGILDIYNELGTSTPEDTKGELASRQKGLVQKHKIYSPDLTSPERVNTIVKDFFAAQPGAELPLLTNGFNKDNPWWRGQRTLGVEGTITPEEFFTDETKYQFSPAHGIIATTGDKRATISPEMFGTTFNNLYNNVIPYINELLRTRPKGYEEAAAELSTGLINSIQNEQEIINPILGKTTTKLK